MSDLFEPTPDLAPDAAQRLAPQGTNAVCPPAPPPAKPGSSAAVFEELLTRIAVVQVRFTGPPTAAPRPPLSLYNVPLMGAVLAITERVAVEPEHLWGQLDTDGTLRLYAGPPARARVVALISEGLTQLSLNLALMRLASIDVTDRPR